MKKRTGDDWFPFWIDKWLFGSTRDELTIEQCAVWVDFLALSNKDEGYIRANVGMPYPITRLAGLLNRPEELIQKTIDRCLDPKVNKLRLEPDGTLYMLSHDEYELSERHKRRLDDKVEPSLLKEKDIKKLILDNLNEKNLSYETEKICESGRIDIFIPGNPNQIIEIKSDNSADSIRAGMRQLLDYGIAFPGSILFIVFPGNISTRLKTKLKNHRIKIWKFPTKGHDDRQKDTKRRREKSRIDKNREDKEILNLLSKVKNYPLNKEKDLEFIKELKVEFPDVAILEKVKQICANWLDRPLLKKSRPRVQIRRWVSNEQKWQQEGDKERKVGRLYAKEPQFLSMELLNNVYRIIDGKGGDKGKFYIKAKLAFPKIKTKWQQSDKKPETFIRLVESVQ